MQLISNHILMFIAAGLHLVTGKSEVLHHANVVSLNFLQNGHLIASDKLSTSIAIIDSNTNRCGILKYELVYY